MSNKKTTPPLRGTPPAEGNDSPSPKGWQAKPDAQFPSAGGVARSDGVVVPKLRFPEFREAGEWEEKRLGDVGNVRMCKRILKEQTSPRGDIPFYKIGTFGGVPDAFISREIFENFRNSYPFPKNGAVLISAAGTIGRTVRYNGELAYFQDSNIVWLDNNEYLVADNFLFYLYQLINWAPSVGAIQRLYNENILGTQVKFPTIPEQQKIADCLSSIDEAITAQTQKIDTLKAHKKGLMQQLFPAEGETLSKLRFPEFRDAGEWEQKSIGQLGEVVTGSTPSTAQPEFYGGERLFVSPADISDDRFIKKTKTTLTEPGFRETRPIKANSILFVCIGSTIGKIAQNRYECATNQQINSVIPNSENSDGFVYYALSGIADKIANLAGKQAVPIVKKSLFSSVELTVPKLPEQNRIAICLSSLDELILAQTQKLEALKTHKKGLMQQLFPSLDEVAA